MLTRQTEQAALPSSPSVLEASSRHPCRCPSPYGPSWTPPSAKRRKREQSGWRAPHQAHLTAGQNPALHPFGRELPRTGPAGQSRAPAPTDDLEAERGDDPHRGLSPFRVSDLQRGGIWWGGPAGHTAVRRPRPFTPPSLTERYPPQNTRVRQAGAVLCSTCWNRTGASHCNARAPSDQDSSFSLNTGSQCTVIRPPLLDFTIQY